MKQITIGKYTLSKDLLLFLIISVLMGVVLAVDSTSFANRLYEDLHFTVLQRSGLEAPRELPGLLTVVIIGLLSGMGDIRMAALANILGGIGLFAFGQVPGVFSLVLVTLLIYSTGQHLYFPLSSTIAMQFAKGDQFGARLGQIQGLGSAVIIVASAVLYLIYRFFDVTYQAVFSFAGIVLILVGVLFLFMRNDIKENNHGKRFVFKKEYKMYYALATVNGARKQITLTFAPWLLIDIFGQPVTVITALFFLVCVLNLFFKPWYGRLIDRRGESYALKLEAFVMFAACMGFAFSKSLFPFQAALILVGISYVADKLMESAGMARATYVRKMCHAPSEVSRTLAMGQSMDHVVSMTIPLLAGAVWYANGSNGYMYVFIGGMAISALNYYLASKLKSLPKHGYDSKAESMIDMDHEE
jgi:hypothetical protein